MLASLSVFLACFYKYHSRNQHPPLFPPSPLEKVCVTENVSTVTLADFHVPAFISGQLKASQLPMLSASIFPSRWTTFLHAGPGSPSPLPPNADDSTFRPLTSPDPHIPLYLPLPALLVGHVVSLRTETYTSNHKTPSLICRHWTPSQQKTWFIPIFHNLRYN